MEPVYVTVAELAAFLGMTPAGVRSVIHRKHIERRGTGQYGAALYDPHDVLRHTGRHDRLATVS